MDAGSRRGRASRGSWPAEPKRELTDCEVASMSGSVPEGAAHLSKEDSRGPGSGLRSAFREVALIVLGVLIALSLDALWQYRVDRGDEGDLLAGLQDEFTENAETLDRWIELHREVATSTEAFLARLEAVPQGSTVSIPDSLIAELGRTPTFDPELNSLDAALSSGQISLIRSVRIQRALASWSRSLSDAQEEEQRAADQAYREFLPLLGEATMMGPAVSWLVEDVRSVMRRETRRPKPTTSSLVRADPRLINALWVRYRLSRSAENELQILRAGLDGMLELLEQEVN